MGLLSRRQQRFQARSCHCRPHVWASLPAAPLPNVQHLCIPCTALLTAGRGTAFQHRSRTFRDSASTRSWWPHIAVERLDAAARSIHAALRMSLPDRRARPTERERKYVAPCMRSSLHADSSTMPEPCPHPRPVAEPPNLKIEHAITAKFIAASDMLQKNERGEHSGMFEAPCTRDSLTPQPTFASWRPPLTAASACLPTAPRPRLALAASAQVTAPAASPASRQRRRRRAA